MAKFKRENQLDMEQLLVASCSAAGVDQALATGAFVNTTTALNLNSGQLGLLSWDFEGTDALGSFLTAGATASDVRAIKIIQGTPVSTQTQNADVWEAGHQAYVESGVIDARNVRSVVVKKCKPGKWSANAFVDIDDAQLTCCGTEFTIRGDNDSLRNDRDFGKTTGPHVNATFTTPDYTALGTADIKDHLLQNLLYDLNLNSRLARLANPGLQRTGNGDYVAFAINSAGGAGTPIGTLTCGDSIDFLADVFSTCDNCGDPGTSATSSVTVSVEMMRTLACIIDEQTGNPNIVNPITAASTIEVIDLSTAGAAANVDSFIVLGLPQYPVDNNDCFSGSDIKHVCTEIDVSLGGGFASDTMVM